MKKNPIFSWGLILLSVLASMILFGHSLVWAATPTPTPHLIPEYYITTMGASNITATSATLGGYAPMTGYTSVTINFSYSDGVSTYSGGSGVATPANTSVYVNVTGLKPNTRYQYYAFVMGSPGGHNGNWVYFTTLPGGATVTPTPTTTPTPTPTRPVTPTPTSGPTVTPGTKQTRIESSVTSLNLISPVSATLSVTLKDASSGVGIPGKTISFAGSYFYFPDGASVTTDSQGVATIRYSTIAIGGTGTEILNTSISATFAGDSVYAGSKWQIPVTIQLTRPGMCVVSYVIQSDWGNGATVSVTITNKTTSAVNGWTLAWTFPGNQTITNLWNGTVTQSGATVSVKDSGFNANIPASGGSVNFGFNMNYSGTNAKPTAFTLNGAACQIQ